MTSSIEFRYKTRADTIRCDEFFRQIDFTHVGLLVQYVLRWKWEQTADLIRHPFSPDLLCLLSSRTNGVSGHNVVL